MTFENSEVAFPVQNFWVDELLNTVIATKCFVVANVATCTPPVLSKQLHKHLNMRFNIYKVHH